MGQTKHICLCVCAPLHAREKERENERAMHAKSHLWFTAGYTHSQSQSHSRLTEDSSWNTHLTEGSAWDKNTTGHCVHSFTSAQLNPETPANRTHEGWWGIWTRVTNTFPKQLLLDSAAAWHFTADQGFQTFLSAEPHRFKMFTLWDLKLIFYNTCIQVHLNKLECREKSSFFLVTYFKKWNFHIF